MIQTRIRDSRTGEWEELHVNDPRYWEGPYKYEPYPKLLFKATVGRYQDGDLETKLVKSQDEHERAGSQWCESPDEARAYCDRMEAELARAAAEAKAASTKMSQNAREELRAAEQDTDTFVTDVPKPRRGRPRKATLHGENQ